MKRTEGKVVIVTGCALGIGLDTCLLLAKEGAILYLILEESKFVTGSELVIDGGCTCK